MKEKLPDWLENARLQNAGLQLPPDYFDGLADRVFQKMEAENFSQPTLQNDLEINAETADERAAELPVFLQKMKTTGAGFALPVGYFENLPDQFLARLNDEQTPITVDLATELEVAKSAFKLPENYFENLPDRVFEKLTDAEKAVISTQKQSKTIEIRSKWAVLRPQKWAVAAAAAVGLVAVSLLFFGDKIGLAATCETSLCLAQNLTDEDVQAYILENLNEFEAAQLADDESLADVEPIVPTKKHEQIDLDADEIESELNEMLDDLSEEDLENVL